MERSEESNGEAEFHFDLIKQIRPIIRALT